MNIVDPILFQCRSQPFAPAMYAAGTRFGTVTYGRLEEMIHNVSRRAGEEGLVPGNVVVIVVKDPILHAVVILGLAKLGVVTASAPTFAIPAGLHVDAVLSDGACPPEGDRRIIPVDHEWAEGAGRPRAPEPLSGGRPDAPCRVALTSGTTGGSRAMVLTSHQVLMRVFSLQMAYGHGFPDCSRILMGLGLTAGLGLFFMVHTLSRGGTLLMRGENIVQTIEAVSALRVDAMVGTPNVFTEMAEIADQVPSLFAGLRVAISAGSLLTRSLAERVRAKICSNLINTYGTSETGLIAVGPLLADNKFEGAVGYVAPGVRVDIVDPEGKALAPGQGGSIRVRADWAVDGYVNDPELTRARFRDGGFHTGDTGALMANGLLVVIGRESDVIQVGDKKVSPEQIEAAITAYPGVREAVVCMNGMSDDRASFSTAVVWRGASDEPGLKEHLLRSLPAMLVPTTFVAAKTIPRNAGGKIDRDRVKEILAQSPAPVDTGRDGAR